MLRNWGAYRVGTGKRKRRNRDAGQHGMPGVGSELTMTTSGKGKVVVFSDVATLGTNGTTIVRSGPLTQHLVRSLEQEIRGAGDVPHLVIDLQAVTYADDLGLEALSNLYQAMKAEGRKLEWHCSDEKIQGQLRLCGLLTVFQGYGEYL
jgi:anti-anti-sigma factor